MWRGREGEKETQREPVAWVGALCERQGEKVGRDEVALLLRMLAELDLYKESFQVPFIAQTTTYYEREGHTFFSQCEIPDYLL